MAGGRPLLFLRSRACRSLPRPGESGVPKASMKALQSAPPPTMLLVNDSTSGNVMEECLDADIRVGSKTSSVCDDNGAGDSAALIGKPQGESLGAEGNPAAVATGSVACHPGQKRIPYIGISIRWFVLIFLVVQNSCAALFMRCSRASSGAPEWNSQTGVIMQEVLKGMCCVILLGSWADVKAAFQNKGELLRTGVPAFLYLVQNNMQYVAVSYLDAPTYAVLYQLKILTTAVLSATLLGKSLSAAQWVALCVLTAGVSMVTLSQLDPSKAAPDMKANVATGFVAVLLAASVSGLAGVYFEMILKGSTVSLWARNLQMALYSVVIGVAGLVMGGDMDAVVQNGFFHGYTVSAWMAIVNNALGGLLIAMVIKYADNILKNFSQSLSIILTAIVSYMMFDSSMSVLFGFGVACVLYAMALYGGVITCSLPSLFAKSSEQSA